MRRTKSILITFLLCFVFWLLLTMSVAPKEIIGGIIICGISAWFASGFFVQNESDSVKMLNPLRWVMLVFYLIFIFGWELIKSNCAMAACVLFNKPIKQAIIRVPVHGLKDGYALALLSNCITMTPGTITLDVAETKEADATCDLYVQWLTMVTDDRNEAGEIIKGRMEKWIRRIWGE